MQLPSLSVLIPCYNGLPFVLDAVRSVLGQWEAGVECVVVDDGSKDGSAAALGSVSDKIKLIAQANAGPAAARNRALAESTGELIVWFDADDLLVPDTLALRRKAFADDPALEMLVGVNEIFNVDTGERYCSPPQAACDEHYLINGLLARRHLPHLNAITFRRSALDRIGAFDANLPTAEDYDLWLRAWSRLRWRFVNTIASQQREGSYESATRRRGMISKYRDAEKVLTKNRPMLREVLGSDLPWRKAFASWAMDVALLLLKNGQHKEARYWSLRAIATRGVGVEARAYKYLLEGSLPSWLYNRLRSVSRSAARAAWEG